MLRAAAVMPAESVSNNLKGTNMHLGAFSVSLAVKDLAASRLFYEKLGFAPLAGDPLKNWLIMKNGDAVIGLFQGMFDRNILTFNPGWDSSGQPIHEFTDVRDILRAVDAAGLAVLRRADEASVGPASFALTDPDGNSILIDQHV